MPGHGVTVNGEGRLMIETSGLRRAGNIAAMATAFIRATGGMAVIADNLR